MSDRKLDARRCMTTLTPEMVAVLPEIERITGLNVSDVLKQGFVKIYREVRTTGALKLEPMPETEAAA